VSVPSEVIDEVAVISPAVRVVIVALVVVELPTMRSVMFARVARRLEKNPVVVVLFCTVALVMTALVVVELPTMRSVMFARVARIL
jgi:uncharacterized MAPEG superfamily protein